MSSVIRLLSKSEYTDCIPLFSECFGEDPEFTDEYFGAAACRSADPGEQNCDNGSDICSLSGSITHARIAGMYENGHLVSMVHILPRTAILDGAACTTELPYIMCVGTSPGHRHKGYMDRVMSFCIDLLRSEGFPLVFLVAVDKAIYRHLGFVHDFRLTPDECELLYADDGLDTASACLLNIGRLPNITIL